MSIRKIIQEIESADTQALETTSDRRNILKQLGTRLAAAAVPVALASMFTTEAKAATDSETKTKINALNVLLRYKYMEADFYTSAIALVSSLISAEDRAAINVISAHENAHVEALKSALDSLDAPLTLKPVFDFTAHGAFADVFTSYTTFMEVMQMIEDGGVRALKGQLSSLNMGDKSILATVLRMQSTEGRHAAHARIMRRLYFANKSAKPWITADQPANIDVPAANLAYVGENNVAQGTFDVTTLTAHGGGYVSFNAATEAFDEPLTQAQSDAIVQLFTA